MIEQAIAKLLQERCTPALVRAIEQGADPAPLWAELEASGFLDLLLDEASGGAGLPLSELFPIVCEFGRHALPLPAAQTIVARALVGRAASGRVTLAPLLLREPDGGLRCPQVPLGRVADQVLAADGAGLRLLPVDGARVEPSGVHGSLAASFVWPADRIGGGAGAGAAAAAAAAAAAGSMAPGDGAVLAPLGAALHAALIAGAMSRVLQMSLDYCNDREQFGRPIGKFQAVQHQLAVMAELVVAANVAAEAAFGDEAAPGVAPGAKPAPALLAAAVAKARASEAAPQVAAIAHAVHGAIGVTEEYDLQLFTRRLHEWRIVHGSEQYWHRVVGEAFLAQDAGLAEFARRV
ncbi:MAG: acyl-CoA dehydrogenase family protein [Burkholderiaceae bacterium]